MLLMIKKRIRGGKCHAIHRYAKANNKCVKNGWAMSQKLSVDGFKWEIC